MDNPHKNRPKRILKLPGEIIFATSAPSAEKARPKVIKSHVPLILTKPCLKCTNKLSKAITKNDSKLMP